MGILVECPKCKVRGSVKFKVCKCRNQVLDARFVASPPFVQMMLKTPSKAILVNEPHTLVFFEFKCNKE